jgi:hypothetical protein
VQTFVVRVFRSEHDGPAEAGTLRGVVDDIETGSRTSFSDAERLLRILGHAAPPPAPPPESAAPSPHLRQDQPTSHPSARRTP